MRYNRILHRIALLLLGGLALGSCIYDHLDDGEPEIESPFTDGYSINVMLTLDNMGGTRALTPQEQTFRTFENYIDPEKCRVLFFDNQGRFLFESKSRWVKQLTAGGEESWLVSVPMYAYGNDVDERWRWQQIRNVMMKEEDADGVSFKIAILVNRPAVEVYPDLETETKDDPNAQRVSTNFDNTGPHWKVEDTRFGGTLDASGNNPNCKTIFDLHHAQADPIYSDKGHPTEGNYKWTGDNFYKPFMGIGTMKDASGLDRDIMSATSSWVDYGNTNDDDSPRTIEYGTNKRRAARAPDTNYPIPMYGVQNFGPIKNWVDGVPFNLSNFTKGNDASGEYIYKSIALLRSVVKLELVVPNISNRQPYFVALAYSNIYARCEPMDVWTPTEEIWKDGAKHENRNQNNPKGNCEWFTLQEYSRIVEHGRTGTYATTGTLENYAANQNLRYTTGGTVPPNNPTAGTVLNATEQNNPTVKYNLYAYRKRLAWFYGAWLDNEKWQFPGLYMNNNGTGASGRAVVEALIEERGPSPRIFNPCIQRNQYVYVDEENRYDDGMGNYHYIVYTGERNQNDPNRIYAVDAYTGVAPTVCFWVLGIEDGNYVRLYSIPITSYNGNTTAWNNVTQFLVNQPKDRTALFANPGNMSGDNSYMAQMVTLNPTNLDLLPWPLMRNHHYTITIGGVRADDGELTISSDVKCSETLERNPAPAPAPEKPAKE